MLYGARLWLCATALAGLLTGGGLCFPELIWANLLPRDTEIGRKSQHFGQMVGMLTLPLLGNEQLQQSAAAFLRGRPRLFWVQVCCEWLASSDLPRTPKVQQRSNSLGSKVQWTDVFILSTKLLRFLYWPCWSLHPFWRVNCSPSLCFNFPVFIRG